MAALGPVAERALAYVQNQPYTSLIVTVLVICLTTRLVTGQQAASNSAHTSHFAQLPPSAPYWVPFFGHLPQLAARGDRFFAGLRNAYPNGLFALNLLGQFHTVVYDPELTDALSELPEEVANGDDISRHLLQTAFGYPRSQADADLYRKIVPDLRKSLEAFTSADLLKQTVSTIADRLRHNIADLVTFNTNEVDQAQWERLAYAAFVEDAAGAQATEADLFDLVRNFVAFTASAALVGTDFIENFSDVWQPFWRFDEGFMALAADVPAFLPVNKAIGARRARGQVLRCMDEFETALETSRQGTYPGPQWADIDNVSPLLQDRLDNVYRKHSLDVRKRASLDFALLWAMNTTVNPLVFWSLWRTCSDPSLLGRIRHEIAPHVTLEKPAVGFGGTYASTLRIERIDMDALFEQCPLLKSACIETMRLDAGSWSFKKVQKDTVVTTSEDASGKWFLPAGTYVHAAYGLHHTDPKAFPLPQEFDVERHLKRSVADQSDHKARAVDPTKLVPLGRLHDLISTLFSPFFLLPYNFGPLIA